MKRTTYIISIFGALAMLLSACSDFLDREPWDSVDTSEGFQTAEDAVAAVNAAYQPLQWAKLYNMRIWTLDISDNPNITFDASDVCYAWENGAYILIYDKTQNITNCEAMLE